MERADIVIRTVLTDLDEIISETTHYGGQVEKEVTSEIFSKLGSVVGYRRKLDESLRAKQWAEPKFANLLISTSG